ncbi:MAG: MBL fold metallo-hydrolase [Anaerorhabdus sp.]
MIVTYIGHSGYLVELETCYLLFDYYTGELPPLKTNKKIIVFISHHHHDHFNPDVFTQVKGNERIIIYSLDIQDKLDGHQVSANQTLLLPELKLTTLKSTDEGVAFVVEVDGYIIYHAGDLNCWIWNDESFENNKKMQEDYLSEIDKLKAFDLDVAFLPLDPRQEEYEFMGIEQLVQKVMVKKIFPMHFWDDYTIIERYNKSHVKQVVEIKENGQSIIIE